MSTTVIIYAHPSREGTHGYMLTKIEEKLKEKNQQYELIDLYQINYNPVLANAELYSAKRFYVSPKNQTFQEKIQASQKLIFIYPTWWQNMPAILKGFIDRVFVGGFGFKYQNGLPIGLLKGKKAAIFSATGGPRFFSRFFTGNISTKILAKHVLRFCGLNTKSFGLGSARGDLNEKQKNHLDKIADKILAYLE